MKNLVAGVDIGGTATAYALIDEFGKRYASGEFPTKEYKEFDMYVAKLRDGIKDWSFNLDEPHLMEAIGIGAPNGNYYTGEIDHASNRLWKGNVPDAKQ